MIVFHDISFQNSASVRINFDYNMARTFSRLWFNLLLLRICNLVVITAATGEMAPAPKKELYRPKGAAHPVAWSPELNWVGNFFCPALCVKLGNVWPLQWVKFSFLIRIEAFLLPGSYRVLCGICGIVSGVWESVGHAILRLWHNMWFFPIEPKFSRWGTWPDCHFQSGRHEMAMQRHF